MKKKELKLEEIKQMSKEKVVVAEIMKELGDYLDSDQYKKDIEEDDKEFKKEQQNKIVLDKEKASYLFDKKEIENIEKDLNENSDRIYPIYYPDSDGSDGIDYLTGEQNPNLTKKEDKELFETMAALSERSKEKELFTANISMGKDNKIQIKEKNDPIRENTLKEIKSIEKDLANQEGLSKLWTINEKFGIDPKANINEEEVFNKLIKFPKEMESCGYKRKPKKITDTVFKITCPKCKGNKKLNVFGLKVKCFKCKGLGSILVDAETYYKNQKNTKRNMTWREQYREEQKAKKGFGSVVSLDSLGDCLGQHSHPDFYQD